jgi:hypothetical protein
MLQRYCRLEITAAVLLQKLFIDAMLQQNLVTAAMLLQTMITAGVLLQTLFPAARSHHIEVTNAKLQ